MATSEGIPSSIDIEFLELNDNPYGRQSLDLGFLSDILVEQRREFFYNRVVDFLACDKLAVVE